MRMPASKPCSTISTNASSTDAVPVNNASYTLAGAVE